MNDSPGWPYLLVDVVGDKATKAAAKSIGLDLVEDPSFEIEPDGTIDESLLMVLRMTHLPDNSPDDWEYQESPKVQKSLRQGLSLVHISASHKYLFWAALGGFSDNIVTQRLRLSWKVDE